MTSGPLSSVFRERNRKWSRVETFQTGYVLEAYRVAAARRAEGKTVRMTRSLKRFGGRGVQVTYRVHVYDKGAA